MGGKQSRVPSMQGGAYGVDASVEAFPKAPVGGLPAQSPDQGQAVPEKQGNGAAPDVVEPLDMIIKMILNIRQKFHDGYQQNAQAITPEAYSSARQYMQDNILPMFQKTMASIQSYLEGQSSDDLNGEFVVRAQLLTARCYHIARGVEQLWREVGGTMDTPGDVIHDLFARIQRAHDIACKQLVTVMGDPARFDPDGYEFVKSLSKLKVAQQSQ